MPIIKETMHCKNDVTDRKWCSIYLVFFSQSADYMTGLIDGWMVGCGLCMTFR